MRFDLVTIFPRMFDGPLSAGVLGRGRERAAIEIAVHDLRDFADPPLRRVDDEVYGGGPGMVFRIEPMRRAVASLRRPGARASVVRPTPAGELLRPALARELAGYEQVLVLCDRYEGADERVSAFVTHEVSLGDVVLTGGELAAMVLVDAVSRYAPGVVGKPESVREDSFEEALLDHPGYTRPAEHDGGIVPEALLSGDHARIAAWRRRLGLRRTLERRPDLLREQPIGADKLTLLAAERQRATARN